MRRVVYVVGEPGTGKSHLLEQLTREYPRALPVDQPKRELLLPVPNQVDDSMIARPVAVELGSRQGKHPAGFPGTDAMGMAAIVGVEDWLVSGRAFAEAPVILGEGARLGVKRFALAVLATGAELFVMHLVNEELAAERRAARGSNQNPGWIKGARTRAARFAEYVDTYPDDCVAVQVDAADADRALRMLQRLTTLRGAVRAGDRP